MFLQVSTSVKADTAPVQVIFLPMIKPPPQIWVVDKKKSPKDNDFKLLKSKPDWGYEKQYSFTETVDMIFYKKY